MQELREQDEGSLYFYQVAGSTVVTLSGEPVGKVIDMIAIPDNDILVVERMGKEILIPFTSEICIRVDAKNKEIVIDPPPGLLELDEI